MTIKTTIEMKDNDTSIEFHVFPAQDGKRSLSYTRNNSTISIDRADAISSLLIIDIQILLHQLNDWLTMCHDKYGCPLGTDQTTTVTFSKPDGISSISFAGDRVASFIYDNSSKTLSTAEGIAPAEVSIATILRIDSAVLEWIKRKFEIWPVHERISLPEI